MPLFREHAEEATSTLIAAIYDAALNPAKWQDFVNALPCELDGVQPVLYLADTKTAVMESLLVSEQWGDEFLAAYMARYNALNPWTPHLRTSPGLWQPVVGDQVMTEREFKRTEFYSDFFKKYWSWSSVVGVVNYRDRSAFSVLGLHSTRKLYDRHSAELCRFAAQLSPHITRAFEISRQLQHGAAWRASLEQMLESLASPALLIRADLRVRYANGPAEELFRSGALALDGRGRIAAGSGAQETSALRLALSEMLAPTPTACPPPSALTVTPPNDEASTAIPLLACVMPCAGGLERAMGTPNPVPPIACEPEALLLIADRAAELQVGTDMLQQIFGLTPAEARLAQALTQGTSLQGYAAAAGVTEGTVRIELKSVFAKTGTPRQAELVALLARLARPFQLG